ncbi:MAG: hypothetical protein PWQ57_1015 [Desulfovibrionales bacterium]|nr:hypothetical protein [Desulfovibrionales bacterium]
MNFKNFLIIHPLFILLLSQLCSCGPLLYPQTWSAINAERDEVENTESGDPEAMYAVFDKLNQPIASRSSSHMVAEARNEATYEHRSLFFGILLDKAHQKDPYALMLLSIIYRDPSSMLHRFCGSSDRNVTMKIGLDYGWEALQHGVEFPESSNYNPTMLLRLCEDFTKFKEYDRAIFALEKLQGALDVEKMATAALTLTDAMLQMQDADIVFAKISFLKDDNIKRACLRLCIEDSVKKKNFKTATALLIQNKQLLSENYIADLIPTLTRRIVQTEGCRAGFFFLDQFDSQEMQRAVLLTLTTLLVEKKQFSELNELLPPRRRLLDAQIVETLIVANSQRDAVYGELLTGIALPWVRDGRLDSRCAAMLLPELVNQRQIEGAARLYREQPHDDPAKFQFLAIYCSKIGDYPQALAWESKHLHDTSLTASPTLVFFAAKAGELELAQARMAALDEHTKANLIPLLQQAEAIKTSESDRKLTAKDRLHTYLDNAKAYYQKKQYAIANLYFNALERIGVDLPTSFHYYYALSLLHSNEAYQARQELFKYLGASAGKKDKHYQDALRLLDSI